MAAVVGIQPPWVRDEEQQISSLELLKLGETLGYFVVDIIVQKRRSPCGKTVVGSGKLEELAGLAAEGVSVFLFDLELSPAQISHVAEATGVEVLDRTGVILEIFHRHAKTREARLQIERARLKYLAPRSQPRGERRRGGIGGRGAGETERELDRRRARERIAELERELEAIGHESGIRRARRHEQPRVALVGYTNAGKSSWMRALTGSLVRVDDLLFVTLDTTIRVMQPESYPRVLVSDTVGFIRKLPHDLVPSFRSTLEEVREASLLLYIVDAADPNWHAELEVVREAVRECLGEEKDISSWVVLNKADLLDEPARARLSAEMPVAFVSSAWDPRDVTELRRRIAEFFTREMGETDILVPYDRKGVLGEVRRLALVARESFESDGVHLRIKAPPQSMERLRQLLAA
jgi:GTP-binding protein HflX